MIKIVSFLIGVATVCTLIFAFHVNNIMYITPLFFIISSCIVIILPDFAPSLHKKPIYLNDISIDETEVCSIIETEQRERRKFFYSRFKNIINFSFACLMTIAMDYCIYRVTHHDGHQSYVEIIGIIGGIVSLWNRVQQLSGRVLLRACFIIQQYKENTHRENLLNLLKKPPRNYLISHENTDVFLGV